MPDPVIRARDLTVRFDGPPVLADVSLEVPEGDFVGIVGPNGSGKTTLLRTILGLETPDQGTVEVLGAEAQAGSRGGRVGYVPQHAVDVDPHFPASALEVTLMGRVRERGLLRRWTDEDKGAARAALETVGVGDLAGRTIGSLSGGERQRVFVAKALVGDPDVLLLDEPTAGVDPGARQDFYNLVDGLNHEQGLTIVLVSHDVQALSLCCHRLVGLNRRVVYDGDPQGFEDLGGFSSVYDMRIRHHEPGAEAGARSGPAEAGEHDGGEEP